jgi:hypothetical protein
MGYCTELGKLVNFRGFWVVGQFDLFPDHLKWFNCGIRE